MDVLNISSAVRDTVWGSRVGDPVLPVLSIDRALDAVGRSLLSRTDPAVADGDSGVSLVGVRQFAEPGAQ